MTGNRNIFLLLLGVIILAGITYFASSDIGEYGQRNQPTYSSNIRHLTEQLNDLDANSDQARSIRKTLRKLRQKQYGGKQMVENPDAFITALREVKTGVNGELYQANYQYRELRKARQFKISNNLRTKSLPWVSRGPGNVSGRSRGMAIDPSDPSNNTWFLATVGGGVWKTTDAGDTWEHKTPDLLTISTTSIVIAPSNPDIMYLGTGMGYGRVVDLEGSGIWKSTDHGESWIQLESTANGELLEAVNRIVVDPDDENIVLVCTNNSYTSIGPNGGDRKSGIFRSVDGGVSWIQVFDPQDFFGTNRDNRVQQIIANPDNFNEMYASVNEVGVVKTIDGGITWTVSADDFARPEDIGQGEGTYSGVSTRIELAIAPSNTDRIYASVERPYGTAQLYMSKDAGNSWKIVPTTGQEINWHSAYGTSGAEGAYTSGWFNNTIVVNPFNPNVLFVGGVNLFQINITNLESKIISPIAWWFGNNQYGVPWVHGDNHFFITIPGEQANFRIVSPNDGGVAISPDNGNTWMQKTGMITTQFYGVDKKPGEPVYIGGTQDNGTWISEFDPNENSTWEHVIGGDGFETVWNYKDPNLIMGSSQNGNVRRSADGGESWSRVLDARGSGGPFISKISNVKTDPDFVFTITWEGLGRSDDFGLNWQLINLSPWIGYRPFSTTKISIPNPQVVWAASRFTKDYYGNTGGVHVSRDGGFTFEDVTGNLPDGLSEASGMATHPTLEGTAFLLFSAPGVPKILRTDDFGETWKDISGFSSPAARTSPSGFPDVAVFTLVVMPYDTNIIWAGTEIGLFISTDAGATWALADNGFPYVSVFEMKIVDDEIVVATYGRGIWTAQIPELSDYTLPEPVLSPRLTEFIMLPTGELKVKADLRTAYDSTHITLDDQIETRIYNNPADSDTSLYFAVTEDRYTQGRVLAYKDGIVYKSSVLETNIFIAEPRESYVNLFNEGSDSEDFFGNGFSVRNLQGFSTAALHSAHPYPEQKELIYQLKVPIIVKSESATLRYKDVALIEEGVASSYTESGFYDYVILEGTSDGVNWQALAPGYDSRADPNWYAAYLSGAVGTESLFVGHEIDLRNIFNAGDHIFIRFRLISDPLVTSWGWAIDNLIIQDETITNVVEEPIDDGSLSLYPNPAKSSIKVQLSESDIHKIEVYSGNGKLIRSFDFGQVGRNKEIDVSDFTDGLYILKVYTNKNQITSRFIKD